MPSHSMFIQRATSLIKRPATFLSPPFLATCANTRVSQTPYSVRYSSYSRPELAESHNPRKKVTIQALRKLYEKREPITVLTATDYPSGLAAEAAGIEMVLVGDSLGMVTMGLEDTNEVTLDDILLHCRSVSRAVKSAFTIADLPMGTYETSPEKALTSALRLMKEGRANGIKMECSADMAPHVRAIAQAGIPVVGHIGLTPQRQHSLGGFRVQGKSVQGAVKLLEDAMAVQEAGAFMVLIEAVPEEIAAIVTRRLRIPTIGIGSGGGCSGQVLVQADMLGGCPGGLSLKFVKRYADVWRESVRAIEAYRGEVKRGGFPAKEHTYPVKEEVVAEFRQVVDTMKAGTAI